jgi:hypothetical protein
VLIAEYMALILRLALRSASARLTGILCLFLALAIVMRSTVPAYLVLPAVVLSAGLLSCERYTCALAAAGCS